MASLHGFYDNALEAFATAIDVKHINIHGHSLRVGRYCVRHRRSHEHGSRPKSRLSARPVTCTTLGRLPWTSVCSANQLLWMPKNSAKWRITPIVGHQIVSGVQFPWPRIPEIVRWHHERSDGSGYPDGLLLEDVPMPVRIVGLADTFDAMTSERPYRERLSLGSTLSEIVRLTPQKFDPNAVHALLLQIRRDTVGSNRTPFLQDRMVGDIAASDIDQLAASLQHKMNHGRLYLT